MKYYKNRRINHEILVIQEKETKIFDKIAFKEKYKHVPRWRNIGISIGGYGWHSKGE